MNAGRRQITALLAALGVVAVDMARPLLSKSEIARAQSTATSPQSDTSEANPAIISQESTEVQLLGAISRAGSSSAGRSVALVKHRASGRVAAVPLGGRVFEVGELIHIQSKSIVIKDDRGGQVIIYAKLGGARAPGLIAPPQMPLAAGDRYSEEGFERIGNKIRVDSAYRDRMVTKELPTILMSAASEPYVENGKIKGFRLFQFEPGSIFEKLGMQDGDIVESINGVPLNDVARTIQFLNGLKAERDVELSVVRNGKPVKLNLNVN
jgi:general secretion pathway protein C